jgi:hypothetical protein
MAQDFIVNRADLREAKMVDAPNADLQDGQVLLEVERFALTANNISYGMAGDMLGYWNFFPAADGWGRIPAWGIARVTRSAHPDITEGARFFGYMPMSHQVVMTPVDVSARGFSDGADHRAQLPPIYQEYLAVTSENGFDPSTDDLQCILRILFVTSMHLDDHLAAHDYFNANTLIIGSASSKTAIGLAWLAAKRPGLRVVGLTSAGNKEFVEGLGCYDTVLGYDEISSLDASAPSVYVDMSGNKAVLTQVHTHLGDTLKNSTGVGLTHWESAAAPDAAEELPGPTPDFFFVPTHMVEHRERQGLAAHDARISAGAAAFYDFIRPHLAITPHSFADMEKTYASLLGGLSPTAGHMVTVTA